MAGALYYLPALSRNIRTTINSLWGRTSPVAGSHGARPSEPANAPQSKPGGEKEKPETNHDLQVDESLAEGLHISRSVRDALLAAAGARSHPEAKEVSLSNEARLAVANAAEEREHLCHKHTGTEHLLLGIMRGRSRAAEVLKQYGVGLESVRDSIKGQMMAVEWDGGVMRRVAALL